MQLKKKKKKHLTRGLTQTHSRKIVTSMAKSMVAEKDTKPTLGQDTATESLRATDNAQKGRGQPMFLLQIHNSETAYSTENRSSSP